MTLHLGITELDHNFSHGSEDITLAITSLRVAPNGVPYHEHLTNRVSFAWIVPGLRAALMFSGEESRLILTDVDFSVSHGREGVVDGTFVSANFGFRASETLLVPDYTKGQWHPWMQNWRNITAGTVFHGLLAELGPMHLEPTR